MNEPSYFVWREDKPEGPYTQEQLIDLKRREPGLFWAADGAAQWKPLSEFPEPAPQHNTLAGRRLPRSQVILTAGALLMTLLLGVTIGFLILHRSAPSKKQQTDRRTPQAPQITPSQEIAQPTASQPAPGPGPGDDLPFEQLRKMATDGDPAAQYKLGRRYFYGQGVQKDLSAAVNWWQEASEKGDPSALNAMGLCYERGEGLKKDMARAFECFNAAAGKGNEKAQSSLAYLQSQGFTKTYVQQLKTPPDLSRPEGVVRAYLNAASVPGRLDYVMLRPQTKTTMEQRYANVQPDAWPIRFDADSIAVKQLSVSNSIAAFMVALKTWADWRFETFAYYVVRAGTACKIDWEASMGINSMTLIAFKVTKPSKPQAFRLTGRLSDYYNWEFQGTQAHYYSISLRESDYGLSHDSIAGFVDKRSKDGQLLFALFSDGAEHPVAVELRFSPNNQDPSVALISRVVGDGWFIP